MAEINSRDPLDIVLRRGMSLRVRDRAQDWPRDLETLDKVVRSQGFKLQGNFATPKGRTCNRKSLCDQWGGSIPTGLMPKV